MSHPVGLPAFPRAGFGFAYRDEGAEIEWGQEGMLLRDYFATHAMQAVVSESTKHPTTDSDAIVAARIAKYAYLLADAMLSERAKP